MGWPSRKSGSDQMTPPPAWLALMALAFCLAASPASAPQAAPVMPRLPPPGLQLASPSALRGMGAADLFAALTQPDRSTEIDALRTIRRSMADADDPHARDAARDQVDSLLDLEERRQPDVAPALVLSSLATRIDSAVAGLEQAARGGGARDGAGWLDALLTPRAMLAGGLLAVSVALTMGASAGLMAGLLGRRRFRSALAACGAALDGAAARLDAAARSVGAAQDSAGPAVAAAADAARDSAVAVARLSGATMEADMRWRECLDAMDVRNAKAMALAAECDRLSRGLPEVFAGAIDMVEARGLPAIDAVARRLEAAAAPIAEASATLPQASAALAAGGARLAEASVAQEQTLAAGLDRAGAFAGLLQDIAASLAASAARVRHDAVAGGGHQAASLPAEDASGAGDADQGEPEGQAVALAAAVARAHGFVGLLPEITANLAAAAAQLRREAHLGTQALTEAAAELGQAAAGVQVAAGAAEANVLRLDQAASAHAAAQAAAQAETREQVVTAAWGLAETAAELRRHAASAIAADGARIAAADAMRAESEAVLAALPTQTALLTQAAVALPNSAAALTETAAALRQSGEALACAADNRAEIERTATARLTEAAASIPAGIAAMVEAAAAVRESGTVLSGAAKARAGLDEAASLLAAVAAKLPADLAVIGEAAVVVRDTGVCMAEAARARAQTDAAVSASMAMTAAEWPRAAAALTRMAVDVGNDLTAASSSVSDAACGLAQHGEQQQMAIAALAARAEQAVGLLPAEAGQLAAAAIGLRHEAAALGAAAERKERAADHDRALPAALHILFAQVADLTGRLERGLSLLEEDHAAAPPDPAVQELHAALAAQAERMGGLLGRVEDAVAEIRADAARQGAAPQAEPHLAQIEAAVERAMTAAERVSACVEAESRAAAQVAQAAQGLAKHLAPDAPAPTLAWLSKLANQVGQLRVAVGDMADAASSGAASGLPAELATDMPALLETIEATVQGLRGTATALAIAGDAARVAA